jgi:hypothetical protein
MSTIKYHEFQKLLKDVDLHIFNRNWRIDTDEKLILNASIEGVTGAIAGKPNIIDGVNSKSVHVFDGKSAKDVIDRLWQMATTNKLFIGTYNNYTELVQWDSINNKFVRRPLTKEELLGMNCPI